MTFCSVAIARVSGTIDTMVSTADKSMQTILDEICALAVDKAVENGAVRESVKIAEMDCIPLQVRRLSFFPPFFFCWSAVGVGCRCADLHLNWNG